MTEQNPELQLPDFPPNWWQNANIIEVLVKQFRKHILCLLVGGHANDEYQYYAYTGFLLDTGDKLLWLSAGHVIKNINDALVSPNFQVTTMAWLDDADFSGAKSISVSRGRLKMKHWLENGLDFGAIIVPFLDAQMLRANPKVLSVREAIWRNLSNANPEGYYLIGFPRSRNAHQEESAPNNKTLHSLVADLLIVPVEPIARPILGDVESSWNTADGFYGQILPFLDWPDFQLGDIKGMSGGPIFSIERTSDMQFVYRLVGIQSEWFSPTGQIRAEPIERIETALNGWGEL